PLTTVDKLILLWRHTQDSLVTGLMKPKEPKPGRFTYMFFPPHWLSPEDLRRLNGEGSAVPKIPVSVDADVVPMLEPIVDLLKTGNAFPRADGVASKDAVDARAQAPTYIFKKAGDYWTIVYEGKETHLNDCKGLQYLAFLLQNPKRAYLALQLVMYVNGNIPEPDPQYSSMSREELESEGLDSIGLHEDDVENARSSVSHAINRVLKKLRRSDPACYGHFRASITSGKQISYRPTTPIHWEF
ncbi:MAG: hypothetical protein KBC96_11785, partial [Armatimonadetes bacterium]|nr:hypothetical protein [Armatimonadota bacterium]